MEEQKQILGEDTYKLFGVTKEEHDQAKEIKPTFDLGSLEKGTIVQGVFLADKPSKIEIKNAKYDKSEDGTTLMIPVLIKETKFKDSIIEYDSEFTLWLSSKTLRTGILTLFEKHGMKLNGKKFKIEVSEANFKEGTNTCYNVY